MEWTYIALVAVLLVALAGYVIYRSRARIAALLGAPEMGAKSIIMLGIGATPGGLQSFILTGLETTGEVTPPVARRKQPKGNYPFRGL